jgi:hypothetical protein
MNLRTTLVLAALLAVGAVVWYQGPQLPRAINPTAPTVPAAEAGTLATLEEKIKPDAIKSIVVKSGKETLVKLERGEKGGWVLPGGWPTRDTEITALVDRLGSLRSRFAPIPLETTDSELKKYGLQPPAYTVTVHAGPTDYVLAFGEASTEEEGFFRPTYLRLDENPEVIRLGPGLLSVFNRPQDYYQKRQLVQPVREDRSETAPEKVERVDADAIVVKQTGENATSFEVRRVNGVWRLSSPSVDRLDPEKIASLREAVADLWAERFVSATPAECVPGWPAEGLAPLWVWPCLFPRAIYFWPGPVSPNPNAS